MTRRGLFALGVAPLLARLPPVSTVATVARRPSREDLLLAQRMAIPELIAAYSLRALRAQLVMAAFVNRNYDGEFGYTGDTVNTPMRVLDAVVR